MPLARPPADAGQPDRPAGEVDVVETANANLRAEMQRTPAQYVVALERNLASATNSIQFLADALDRYARDGAQHAHRAGVRAR